MSSDVARRDIFAKVALTGCEDSGGNKEEKLKILEH